MTMGVGIDECHHHQRRSYACIRVPSRRHCSWTWRTILTVIIIMMVLLVLPENGVNGGNARSYAVWRACVSYPLPVRIATLAGTNDEIPYITQRYSGMWSWLSQRLLDNECSLLVDTIGSPTTAYDAGATCTTRTADDLWFSDAASYEWRVKSASSRNCTTRSLFAMVESTSIARAPYERVTGLLLRMTNANDTTSDGSANNITMINTIGDIPIWFNSQGMHMIDICAVSNVSLVGYLAQRWTLHNNGINDTMMNVTYYNTPDDTIYALHHGYCHFAAVPSLTIERMMAQGDVLSPMTIITTSATTSVSTLSYPQWQVSSVSARLPAIILRFVYASLLLFDSNSTLSDTSIPTWTFSVAQTMDDIDALFYDLDLYINGECANGYYRPTNGIHCTPCAPGTYSSGLLTVCSPCDIGFYSVAAASSCSICPTPSALPSSGTIYDQCTHVITPETSVPTNDDTTIRKVVTGVSVVAVILLALVCAMCLRRRFQLAACRQWCTKCCQRTAELPRGVMISYASQNRDAAKSLEKALVADRFKVWVNKSDGQPSDDWRADIAAAIEQSFAIVFIVSPQSVASKYCKEELYFGVNLHRHIVPIVIQRPGQALKGGVKTLLERLEHIDFEKEGWNHALPKLLANLRAQRQRLMQAIKDNNNMATIRNGSLAQIAPAPSTNTINNGNNNNNNNNMNVTTGRGSVMSPPVATRGLHGQQPSNDLITPTHNGGNGGTVATAMDTSSGMPLTIDIGATATHQQSSTITSVPVPTNSGHNSKKDITNNNNNTASARHHLPNGQSVSGNSNNGVTAGNQTGQQPISDNTAAPPLDWEIFIVYDGESTADAHLSSMLEEALTNRAVRIMRAVRRPPGFISRQPTGMIPMMGGAGGLISPIVEDDRESKMLLSGGGMVLTTHGRHAHRKGSDDSGINGNNGSTVAWSMRPPTASLSSLASHHGGVPLLVKEHDHASTGSGGGIGEGDESSPGDKLGVATTGRVTASMAAGITKSTRAGLLSGNTAMNSPLGSPSLGGSNDDLTLASTKDIPLSASHDDSVSPPSNAKEAAAIAAAVALVGGARSAATAAAVAAGIASLDESMGSARSHHQHHMNGSNLVGAGVDVFETNRGHIDNSGLILFITSTSSLQSSVCLDEVHYAYESGRPIVQLQNEVIPAKKAAQLLQGTMGRMLAGCTYVDFYSQPYDLALWDLAILATEMQRQLAREYSGAMITLPPSLYASSAPYGTAPTGNTFMSGNGTGMGTTLFGGNSPSPPMRRVPMTQMGGGGNSDHSHSPATSAATPVTPHNNNNNNNRAFRFNGQRTGSSANLMAGIPNGSLHGNNPVPGTPEEESKRRLPRRTSSATQRRPSSVTPTAAAAAVADHFAMGGIAPPTPLGGLNSSNNNGNTGSNNLAFPPSSTLLNSGSGSIGSGYGLNSGSSGGSGGAASTNSRIGFGFYQTHHTLGGHTNSGTTSSTVRKLMMGEVSLLSAATPPTNTTAITTTNPSLVVISPTASSGGHNAPTISIVPSSSIPHASSHQSSLPPINMLTMRRHNSSQLPAIA